MDLSSVIGLVLGIGAVFGGAAMEGLPMHSILQFTAFVIVLGGSIGAMLLSTPTATLKEGLALTKELFFFDTSQAKVMAGLILQYAETARRDGIVVLEKTIEQVPDLFLRRALKCAVDGMDIEQITDIMETEIWTNEEKENNAGKMYETCGGYCPTIGIIGAVLGLIHVMHGLALGSGTEEMGSGIAVAFVATIYGVGAANLIFIPFGNKLKARAADKRKARQMILKGVLSIVQGKHPMIIQEELKSFQCF